MNDRRWIAALTGAAFVALVIAGFAIGGEPPGADDPVEEIIDFYTDDEASLWISVGIEALAALALVFFGGFLKSVLRRAEGEGHMLSSVAMAGTTIVAVGLAIDATITITLVESVEDLEPAGVQVLSALYENDFVPFVVGAMVFILASGISILRHGALPKWLGWVAIGLAVISLTPIGFVGAIGIALWIAVVSVMLAVRERRTGGAPPPAAPAAPAA
jgi:hypothetical protein